MSRPTSRSLGPYRTAACSPRVFQGRYPSRPICPKRHAPLRRAAGSQARRGRPCPRPVRLGQPHRGRDSSIADTGHIGPPSRSPLRRAARSHPRHGRPLVRTPRTGRALRRARPLARGPPTFEAKRVPSGAVGRARTSRPMHRARLERARSTGPEKVASRVRARRVARSLPRSRGGSTPGRCTKGSTDHGRRDLGRTRLFGRRPIRSVGSHPGVDARLVRPTWPRPDPFRDARRS